MASGVIKEIIFVGRSNTIELSLEKNGSAVDLTDITRIVLVTDQKNISDRVKGTPPIVWDPTVTGTKGKVILHLGNQNLTPGHHDADLVVFDADYPSGIVWRTTREKRLSLYVEELSVATTTTTTTTTTS